MKYLQLKDGRNCLDLAYKKDRILDSQILIVAQSGSGKSVTITQGLYTFYKAGYNIISLIDVKGLLELGFVGFEPQSKWHRRKLELQGMNPTKLPVKIFHPYTKNIPSHQIPEMDFVFFSIQDLGDSEFDFLIESKEDNQTREILNSARDKLKDFETLWDFARLCEEETERKIRQEGSQQIKLPDKKRFSLRGVSTASVKSVDQIYQVFERFQHNLFLMFHKFKYNLNLQRDVFSNRETVKIFTTRYIKDQKTRDFFTLMLINRIIEESNKSKYPTLIIMDEIKGLLGGDSTREYKKILSREMARHLTESFRGRNISSISSSQSFSSISKTLLKSNAFTRQFIGQVTGETDLQVLRTVFGYSPDIIDDVMTLDLSQFKIRGIPNYSFVDDPPVTSLVPPIGICEAGMKFDDYWKRNYPDKMRKYVDLKNEIEGLKKQWSEEAYKLAMEKAKKEIEQLERKKKEKEEKKQLKEEMERMKQQQRTEKKTELEERNQKVIQDRKKGMATRALAKKYNMSQPNIMKILKKYKGGKP